VKPGILVRDIMRENGEIGEDGYGVVSHVVWSGISVFTGIPLRLISPSVRCP